MHKSKNFALLAMFSLSACAVTNQATVAVSKKDEQACEQQALVAKDQYLARVKIPMYTSSFSRTWAGGARTDTGEWEFNAALRTCVQHARHIKEGKK